MYLQSTSCWSSVNVNSKWNPIVSYKLYTINHLGVFARGDGTSLGPWVSRQKKSNRIRIYIGVKSSSDEYLNLLTMLTSVITVVNPVLKMSNFISRVTNMKRTDRLVIWKQVTLESNVIKRIIMTYVYSSHTSCSHMEARWHQICVIQLGHF